MQNLKSVELVNIPTNSLTLVDKFTKVSICKVRQFHNGIIALTGFAIIQFLEGADIMAHDELYTAINSKDVQLMLLLAKSLPMLQVEPVVNIEVTYRDLKTLRSWLELRMDHCEKERDQRTPAPWNKNKQKFNPDTYIGQKLLLLDLRELILGEVISQD